MSYRSFHVHLLVSLFVKSSSCDACHDPFFYWRDKPRRGRQLQLNLKFLVGKNGKNKDLKNLYNINIKETLSAFFQPLTIFAKSAALDVCRGSEDTFDL